MKPFARARPVQKRVRRHFDAPVSLGASCTTESFQGFPRRVLACIGLLLTDAEGYEGFYETYQGPNINPQIVGFPYKKDPNKAPPQLRRGELKEGFRGL